MILEKNMQAKIRLGTGTIWADVVKENDKTIWVKLRNGDIVQRHKDKHVVVMIKEHQDEGVEQ